MNLEMGLPGDISATSFVDETVHGSEEAVSHVQKVLLEGAGSLHGQKVVLCKVPGDGNKMVYDLHLLDSDGETGLQKLGTNPAVVDFRTRLAQAEAAVPSCIVCDCQGAVHYSASGQTQCPYGFNCSFHALLHVCSEKINLLAVGSS